MAFNPFFTRKSLKVRQVVGQVIDMAVQSRQGAWFAHTVTKPELLAQGWEGAWATMAKACRQANKTGVILRGWEVKGTTPELRVIPEVMLRYSQGRLRPADTFGRRVMDLLRVLSTSNEPRTLEGDQAMVRAFARAKEALNQFSLELASKAGKTGRDYPVYTLRMADWVEPGEIRMAEASARFGKLAEGQAVWTGRHPLPTRILETVVFDERVPLGTVLMAPCDAQEGGQADADGDQMILMPDWPGANRNPAAGPSHAMDGVASLADTALAGWLKPQSLRKKVFFDGLLRVDVDTFSKTLHKLSAYSVTGIGQVGYNPSFAMTTLALAGVTAFVPMVSLGFRRLYEDVLLAGLTDSRWDLFLVARDLEGNTARPLITELQDLFRQNGIHFSREHVHAYTVARAIAMGAGQLENGMEAPSKRVRLLMGSYKQHMALYGLVRAVDKGNIHSVFLPNWERIIAQYDASLPLVAALKEICPILLRANQVSASRKLAKELV